MPYLDREAQRAHDRQRYAARREKLLAKRKAAYAAMSPEERRAKNKATYDRYRASILAKQAARNADPAIKAARNAYFRRRRNLVIYGVEDPKPGQKSLDGTKTYMNFGGRFTCAPKPQPAPPAKRATGSASAPKRGRSPSSSTRSTTASKSATGSKATSPTPSTNSGTAPPAATKPRPASSPSSTASTPPPSPPEPWTPTFVDIPRSTPPKPTVYLCSADHRFATAGRARACTRRHQRAA